MRILLVDDEVELTDALKHLFTREGYNVDIAHDGASGRSLALTNTYELLILDWMLPEISGLELCRFLRSKGHATPVLFLTAKDTVDDRVDGLDAGADDYLIKPFELKELLARVRALLRRPPSLQVPDGESRLTVEGIELDEANQLAYRGDRSIELSEKESQLLAFLMQHPNQLLTHEELTQALWATESKPSSNALVAQIRLLRRKIEAQHEPQLIHTVYGKGYRFGLITTGSR
ncbi:MAG: two-component system response regulator RppA [Cyanobacteria bacterium P01_A01_bin.37]